MRKKTAQAWPLALGGALMLAAMLPAQLREGRRAPDLRFTETYHGLAKRLSDVRDHVILLDLFATWCRPCIAAIPHLNDLEQRYRGLGLAVVGVCADKQEDLAAFVAEHGPRYRIGFSPQATRYATEYPTYVLLDDDRRVLEVRSGRHVSNERIEEALAGLRAWPDWIESERLLAAREHWMAGRFGRVDGVLRRVGAEPGPEGQERDELATLRARLEFVVAHARREVDRLRRGPDYRASRERLTGIAERFGDLPPGVGAREELARFAKSRKIAREIRLLDKLEALTERYDVERPASRRTLIRLLGSFARSNRGTFAARRAEALREKLLGR